MTVRVQHVNIRNDKLNTSEGFVEIDAEGFATVDDALAEHILSNPFGFSKAEAPTAPPQQQEPAPTSENPPPVDPSSAPQPAAPTPPATSGKKKNQ